MLERRQAALGRDEAHVQAADARGGGVQHVEAVPAVTRPAPTRLGHGGGGVSTAAPSARDRAPGR